MTRILSNLPNLGNSETGIICLEFPLVTVTVASLGVPIITGSDPVRWCCPLLPFPCFNVWPGEEWTDSVSPFDLRDSVAEFGAEIFFHYFRELIMSEPTC